MTLKIEICQVSCICCLRTFRGSKLTLKKGDIIGNFKVCCRCWVLGVGGGKMHIMRIDLIAYFCGSKMKLKNEIADVN